MSVVKSNVDTHTPKSYKDELWGIENVSKWLSKMVLDLIFFFTIYAIIGFYVDLDLLIYQFIGIFCSYILADGISFFVAYIFIKLIFGLGFKRKVKPFYRTVKYRISRKKVWVYLFTTVFETTFFIISLVTILVGMVLSLPVWVAYVLVWVGLHIIAKILGRILYFIFYQF